ncbi:MAG: 50S ribosomal protein L11 methyltransferase [Chitinophagaceae bacterium]|nr:50S ribosomal protein L11 methyltransferase [Chitinophagaceae bacterium]
MNKAYIQIDFKGLSPEKVDILIATLSEAGWEGFEETEDRFSAYIPEEKFQEEELKEMAGTDPYTITTVPYINWNQRWESSFEPVLVDDFCAVRAGFHAPVENVRYEIVITPKQSFGTGHHATTWLMMKRMEQIDFTGKKVFDFGTGTGVLAILAEKAGAMEVLGIDNDTWSMENAAENGEANNCYQIRWELADRVPAEGKFDIILANINKNVITGHFKSLADRLTSGGTLLLSGLLTTDEEDILAGAQHVGLKFMDRMERAGWICLSFKG